MRMRSVSAGLLALAIASAAHGQSPPRPPSAPIPPEWPQGPAYAAQETAIAPAYSYQVVLSDPRLVRVIDLALANNQDVAAALANIAAAQSQYRVQRAAVFPQLDLLGNFSHAGGGAGATRKGDSLVADASVSGWELDLFGRVQSLTQAQKAKYLGTVAAARGVRVSMVAQISNAWLTYGADTSLLNLAHTTAETARASLELTRKRVAGGVAGLADQRKAEITLATAEADLAAQTTLQAQDINLLRLLAGAEIPAAALPTGIDDAMSHLVAIPAGLSSDLLLRRPDVTEADAVLQAAHANLGAARAALFPRITLTGLAGFASSALSGLFTGGNFVWSGGAGVNWPIFSAGKGRAGVGLATAQQDAALAGWNKTIQTAFRDVSDVLARRGTIAAQLAASQSGRDAAVDNARLTERRYRGGIASGLDNFAAQQAAYASERSLVLTRLVDATSRVALYRALGGDNPVAPSLKPANNNAKE